MNTDGHPETKSASNLTPVDRGTVVVGHDGSQGSTHALQFAFQLADALSCALLIVRTWSIDEAPGSLVHGGYVDSFEEISERARSNLESEARTLRDAHPSVAVDSRGVLGQPAEVLLRVARGARMLVVGSRGRGGFASLLLGSVSDQCVRHATCPVVVVHPTDLIDG
jgi:nucleotide-binding universal stress UspA family protein